MYFVEDSFRVSLKWVVIISTKQEVGHTQSAKVSTCYTLLALWGLVTNYGEGGIKTAGGGGNLSFTPTKRGGGVLAVLKQGHNNF